MHPLIVYCIKVIICSGILFGYYWLALRNKIFHQYNRFYLLATLVLSLALPVIKINFWQQEQAALPVIKLLQAADASNDTLDEIVLTNHTASIDWEQVSAYMYLLASAVMLVIFLHALGRIYYLYIKNDRSKSEGISLVQTEAKDTPFSFFKLIFWNRNIDMDSTTGRQILKHEIAHVQQKHSYDKIFINIILIIFWFNPFFWLIRKELNMIHEFTADKKAVEDCDTSAFAAMILQAAYPHHRFDLTNPFFYSPIKRRLMMLTKNTPTKAGYISRIMVLPLAMIVFAAFTFKAKTTVTAPYSGKKITVVIDAGHGGKDFGAASSAGMLEKDITLEIATRVKALNSNRNINIILSRENDIYQTPMEKADFVNSVQADLLITIHADATHKDSVATRSGMSIWVSKDVYPNASESKILASALIQSFDKDYALNIAPQPMQRDRSIGILQASKCPSVLIETGFLTNDKDLEFLKSAAGKEIIARNILKGIEQFLTVKKTVTTNNINKSDAVNDVHKSLDLADTTKVKTANEIDINKALWIFNEKVMPDKKIVDEKMALIGGTFNIKWLKPTEAMAKYGDRAKFGACEIVHTAANKSGTSIEEINTKEGIKTIVNSNDELTVTLNGIQPGRVSTAILSNELRLVTNHPGYKILGGTIYFTGKDFPMIMAGNINTAESFSATFKENLSKIKDRDTILFDNIIIENPEGKTEDMQWRYGYIFLDPSKQKVLLSGTKDIIPTEAKREQEFPAIKQRDKIIL